MTSAFARFPPRLQEAIVSRLGWSSLRPVQELSSHALLDGKNAIILAPTAGGKTEAAIFPILSDLIEREPKTVGAIYVAPIKALLNNQSERLKTYTEMVGLRRFVWHGDIKASKKKAFVREPAHILMTTPESLEVMLLSSRVPHARLFSDLRAVIVDEIHALAGSDRGTHLISVFERLFRCTSNDVQRIGLSATVGNPEDILQWLQGTSNREGCVIDPPHVPSKKEIRVYYQENARAIAQQASEIAQGQKSLFFCQSRSLAEKIAEQMQDQGVDVFVHHSSVSAEERTTAEERFHRGSNTSIVCTSTLELGIDVGDLDLVLQANAPTTVSSFLQRLGRTGRRKGQKANTTFFCEDAETVLQAIALIELAKKGWVESVPTNNRVWSVLVHQILALTLQFGAISAEQCWQQLSIVSDFSGINRSEFDRLIAYMVRENFLFLSQGLFSIGDKTEKTFGRRNFMEIYAVFSSPQLYKVSTEAGYVIGSLEQNFVDKLFDPHFAVSLSGVRPLPHQLEAVYEKILPQARLRFLLADDPGAGKTIMAGLLLKELKLRQVIERVLILAPAPLTLQWQDELRSKFSETYEVINSNLAKGQLAGNPWERFRQCIASIDFAKRDDIISGILQVDWDLVIIDEAHKCSARKLKDPSRRYRLARELSRISERILLLTATPHQGNAEQFHNFLLLLDPDQFISDTLNPEMLSLDDSPWFLRRIKEDLKDFEGRKLFKERHTITVPFELSEPEKFLYDRVTKYINRYLGKTKGKKQASVALARTVLQRRLASSLNAIFSSLKKRQKRFADLLEELNNLSPGEQRDRLMSLGKIVDTEQDSDDRDEEELEDIAVESTVVEEIDQLREELDELERLVKLARETIEIGTERKLNALKECLARAEFSELKDGRGKLLIFTEHRDTLAYLKQNLTTWGYTTCEIHGGMNPIARKQAQADFRLSKQICLATDAAGEGINLQFCQLMINYDLPWNPNRLEQRMGRIHRIGQERAVYIFNFLAENTVEGRVLSKLLTKLSTA